MNKKGIRIFPNFGQLTILLPLYGPHKVFDMPGLNVDVFDSQWKN
jgi:hypothetical protein